MSAALAHSPLPKSSRISSVDALRGFALAGIMLLHNVEQFNLFPERDKLIPFLSGADPKVWNIMFLFFGGKAYAIFSMLFGFSFWVQYSRKLEKGYDMGARFIWRMALLFSFGIVHSLYYSGDLLVFYATFGLLVVPVRKVGNGVLLAMALLLFLLPYDLYTLARHIADPAFAIPHDTSWEYWSRLTPVQCHGSFRQLCSTYITDGLKANVLWTWEAGRMFHIPALFLTGIVLARKKVFSDLPAKKWAAVLAIALVAGIPLHFIHGSGLPQIADEPLRYHVLGMLGSYTDVALTAVLVSGFMLLWRWAPAQKVQSVLIPYGRMSLTNYLSQGMTGLILYTGCGFGLYHYFGATLSLLTGAVVLTGQLLVSHWWLRRFGQGPMEKLWRRLMWIGYSENQSKSA